MGFEPTHAFTRLTVFKTVPFSRTWVILQNSPYGIRTRVTAVKRRCLNPLTNGPNFMGTSGLEPPTSRLSGVRSNHLSYAPKLKNLVIEQSSKRVTRIEPAIFAVTGRRDNRYTTGPLGVNGIEPLTLCL